MKNSVKTQRQAFTLVELLVAMTVFSIFIAVVSSSYLFLSRSLRDARVVQDQNAEIISVMDTMIDEARVTAIDYECYIGTEGICYYVEQGTENLVDDGIISSSYLVLRSADGSNRTIFRIYEENLLMLKQVRQADNWVAADGFENLEEEPFGFETLQSDKVKINNGKFYLSPNRNPYNYEAGDLRYQPQVTIDLVFETSSQVRKEIKVPIKTTISTRVYR